MVPEEWKCVPISPSERGIEDPKIAKKLVVISEEDRWHDNFKPPSQYYIVNAFNDAVFVRTNDRLKAQAIIDSIYGKNFYLIKRVVKAEAR